MKKQKKYLENSIAPFWKRFIAFVFDLLFINIIVLWPFQIVITKYFSNLTLNNQKTFSEIVLSPKIYFIIFIISILILLYFSFFEYYIGQTPGMMLVRIEAISLNGEISLLKAIIRNCFIIPFFPFYIFWVIDPLYLLFYKERFLERITYTRTVVQNNFNKFQEFNLKEV